MAHRESRYVDDHERYVDRSPRIAARTYQQRVRELRDLEEGRDQGRHPADTVEHRRERCRLWRDAMRAVGVCKKCGERLTGETPDARLARARGVGPTCWEKRCTPEERAEIDAWVERHQKSLADEPV